MSALEAAPDGTAGAPGARDGASSTATSTASSAAGATGGGAAVVVVAPPVVVVVPPPPTPAPSAVSCPDVTVAAMSVFSAADAGSGQVETGDPPSAGRLSRRATAARTGDSWTGDPRLRPDPLWRRTVPRGIRDELIRLMCVG